MAKEIATRCHDDQTLLRFVRIVASAMDAGNPFTHGRAYRCSKQALALGKEAGLSDSTLLDLEYAALLQDRRAHGPQSRRVEPSSRGRRGQGGNAAAYPPRGRRKEAAAHRQLPQSEPILLPGCNASPVPTTLATSECRLSPLTEWVFRSP